MNKQSIQNMEKLLPSIRKLCNHDVSNTPLGTMCGCSAIWHLVTQLKAEDKKAA